MDYKSALSGEVIHGISYNMKGKYSKEFVDLAENASSKSQAFYKNEENENKPNPYFIGFGNPNSKILILGKEKAFNETNLKQLLYESIENPKEWKYYIDNGILFNKTKFHQSDYFINAFRPYYHKVKSGHTWNKYYKLLKNIYPEIKIEENEFFDNTFISEVNPVPSEKSKISKFNDMERLDFLKQDYFKKFPVIICACGNYLNNKQIEEVFDVAYVEDKSKPRERLKVFKNKSQNQILINTRQLSFDVKNDYLEKIAKIIKPYLQLK